MQLIYRALLISCRNTLKLVLDIIQLVKTVNKKNLSKAVGPEQSSAVITDTALAKEALPP